MSLPSLDWQRDDTLRLIVFGPGYGESIILGTKRSGWVVIDSLSADDEDGISVNPALAVLEAARARWELLMLTHPHADHSGGMAMLVNQPDPGIVACVQRFEPVPAGWDQTPDLGEDPAVTATVGPQEQTLAAISSTWAGLPVNKRWDPRAGQPPVQLGDLELHCLWPTSQAVKDFDNDRNANKISTALIVHWGELRVLLGADVLTAQWKLIEREIGAETLRAHGLMKVPHHGSKGATINCLDVCADRRLWVLTPWNRGRGLPRFEDGEGAALLQSHCDELHLSALPFRVPRPHERPFRLTRVEALDLRERSRSVRSRATARSLPLPVHDGWVDIALTVEGAEYSYGEAAGAIVPADAEWLRASATEGARG